MTLPVRLTPAAKKDLALAERWYFSEAPYVLGSFEEEIDRALGRISDRPELYSIVEARVRRAPEVPVLGLLQGPSPVDRSYCRRALGTERENLAAADPSTEREDREDV